MEFKKYKISEISKSLFYGSMPKNDDIAEDGKYPIFSGYRFVGFSNKKNIDEPTLIVIARGVGGTGDVKIAPANSFLTNLSIAIDIDETVVDRKFLYYFLNVQGLRYLDTGAAQSQITINNLKQHSMLLPNLSIQKEIADILSTYDDLIENNNRRITLLEKAAQELYKEWFVRFRFPGHENIEFGNGIPKGWEYVKLGEYANISTGKCNREDAEEDGVYPLFDRSQEIKKSSTWLKDCEAIIVPGEGTSFIPRYYKGKFNLHQRCYCVEPKTDKIGQFIYQTLMLNRIYFLYVATGATVPSLRQNNFTSMKILMPPINLVHKFEEIASIQVQKIDLLKESNENLTKQRDLLLPRLMSGKLEV